MLATIPLTHLRAVLPPAPPDQSLAGLRLLHFTDRPASSLQPPAHTLPQAPPHARPLDCDHLPPLLCMQTGTARCTSSTLTHKRHFPAPEPKQNRSRLHLAMETIAFVDPFNVLVHAQEFDNACQCWKKVLDIPIPPKQALSSVPLSHPHLPFILPLPLHTFPQPGYTSPFPQISPTLTNHSPYTPTTCTAVMVFVQGLTPPYVPKRLEVLPGGHHLPCRSVLTPVLTAGLESPSD